MTTPLILVSNLYGCDTVMSNWKNRWEYAYAIAKTYIDALPLPRQLVKTAPVNKLICGQFQGLFEFYMGSSVDFLAWLP